jgi:tripartite-type tricarboxylate transporter receptor subunit TctC
MKNRDYIEKKSLIKFLAKYLMGNICGSTLIYTIIFLMFTICFVGTVSAQSYPLRPIKLIMPFPPGGAGDAGARILADGLTRQLKQTVYVENRSGANGSIGAEYVAKSTPDGYTLLFGSMGTLTINPVLYSKQSFSVDKDLTPISKVFDTALVIEAYPAAPFSNLETLIAYAKKNPGKLSYASGGNGSSTHMSAELFKFYAGIEITHIPYKGNGPALIDLLAGNVDVMFDQVASSVQYINAGKLKAFAVTSPLRENLLPSVPTVKELGYPVLEMSAWSAVMAPSGTPIPIIEKLSKAIEDVLADPLVKSRIENLGGSVSSSSPAQLATVLRDEQGRWKKIIQSAKIKSD